MVRSWPCGFTLKVSGRSQLISPLVTSREKTWTTKVGLTSTDVLTSWSLLWPRHQYIITISGGLDVDPVPGFKSLAVRLNGHRAEVQPSNLSKGTFWQGRCCKFISLVKLSLAMFLTPAKTTCACKCQDGQRLSAVLCCSGWNNTRNSGSHIFCSMSDLGHSWLVDTGPDRMDYVKSRLRQRTVHSGAALPR